MIKKKICVLGAYSVGKTSLIQRFVKSIFSDKYHTTIGVKIDQKDVTTEEGIVRLILWDINGEDEFQHVKTNYLIGASGYLLVVDGTRESSYHIAKELQALMQSTVGDIPFVVLINKEDLKDEWEINSMVEEDLKKENWEYLFTSAKTGKNVQKAFDLLVSKM
jgi:small GTP-binding protein